MSGRNESSATIAKDHSYYIAKQDYWNQAMFASEKIAKFYLKRRDGMQPLVQQLEQAQLLAWTESERKRTDALSRERTKSLERMERRKYARSKLESASKQKPLPDRYFPGETEEPASPVSRLQLDKSKWELFDEIPASQLRKFISRKNLELDRQATSAIKSRVTEPATVSAFIQTRREHTRACLLRRHQQQADLEAKAGVRKLRCELKPDAEFVVTPYGLSRQHPNSHGGSRLSKSRDLVEAGNDRDLRGLMHVDFAKAVGRLMGTRKDSPVKPVPLRSKLEPRGSVSIPDLAPPDLPTLLTEMDSFCSQVFPPSLSSQAAFTAFINGAVDWKKANIVTA